MLGSEYIGKFVTYQFYISVTLSEKKTENQIQMGNLAN